MPSLGRTFSYATSVQEADDMFSHQWQPPFHHSLYPPPPFPALPSLSSVNIIHAKKELEQEDYEMMQKERELEAAALRVDRAKDKLDTAVRRGFGLYQWRRVQGPAA
jgi:hypothetical protein